MRAPTLCLVTDGSVDSAHAYFYDVKVSSDGGLKGRKNYAEVFLTFTKFEFCRTFAN